MSSVEIVIDSSDVVSQRRSVSTLALVSGTALIVSALQGSFFALEGLATWKNVAALVISATSLVIAVKYLSNRDNKRLAVVIVLLYLSQLAIFAFHLASVTPPLRFRLLQVSIVLVYVASILMVFLIGLRILAPAKAAMVCFSTAFAILIGESFLGVIAYSPAKAEMTSPIWVGSMTNHPTLGGTYTPYSTLKTFYPDNPRGYFEVASGDEKQFWLRAEGGNEAKLIFSNESEAVTVKVDKLYGSAAYDLQLNESNFKVKSKHQYAVVFRARAETERTMFVGFARSHTGWDNLGLYDEVQLTPEWQAFERVFSATDDDDNARIHFDLGKFSAAVEIANLELKSVPDGSVLRAADALPQYFISYEFNAMGCRGPDYEIPKPPDTFRILLLGDSYTLGVGVRNSDTFATRLQQMFDGATEKTRAKKVEVVNCGVSGYGTREERIFYELYGAKYQPDVVLVVMVWNDDLSFSDEVQRGIVNRNPGKLEHLFLDWRKLQDYRHQRPAANFENAAQDLLALNDQLNKQKSRLGVVVFRNDFDDDRTEQGRIWDRLTKTVTNKLAGTGVPIIDLGRSLQQNHSYEELVVHRQVDLHPNEIAHGIAANQIFSLLQNEKMVPVNR